ncbi:MAG: 4Fe-4S dicluster domain-containing protein [Candidatus Bathyarchaeota archaeon]|nr:4Fe-4S dicluster domain-containing protein [Candidatus Termiticorpusculum sp.]MCL2867942.1 4Fe-4S dicluster domain-containing protein [Candidatus Termiticorpusculum sp.]
MPYKSSKQDSSDVLMLEWVLQVKNYRLTLDRHLCVGCQICCLVCPKEAVKIDKQQNMGEKALKSKVDIDLAKCNFCGACDVTCPFGAIKVTLNGVHKLALLAKESYPKIKRTILLDSALCPKTCSECETVCPFKLIKVSKVGFDGQPVKNVVELSPTEKRRIKLSVDIKKDYCPTCKICEVNCPSKILKVTKIFEGKIVINPDKCPYNCRSCVEVCPIPNVLTVDAADGKVVVTDVCCTFCGACKNVCPVVDALVVRRVKVAHERIHSGAWNRALERLTSTYDGVKVLKAVASLKKRDIVIKRLQDEIVDE